MSNSRTQPAPHRPATTTEASPTPLVARSAADLGALIARGDVSALEVVEAHIARIHEVNARLNALVVDRFDAARAEAREADRRRALGDSLGALHGVPVTIKEIIDVAGLPSTGGLPERVRTRADIDNRFVARLRRAGAIVLGKTNVAQLAAYYETDNPLYGRTVHPWDDARTPGGSTGGEAALIAAGGSPLGLGADIGGSLRVPATFCGIASLKPTAGRLPDEGRLSVPAGQQAIASQIGPLAREVGDVALALGVLNTPADADDGPAISLGSPDEVRIERLRVGYYADDGTLAPAPAVRRAVHEAAAALRAAGASVVEWTPPDARLALDLFMGIMSADAGRGLRALLAGGPVDRRVAGLLRAGRLPHAAVAALRASRGALGQRGLADSLRGFGRHGAADYWRLVEAVLDYRVRFASAARAAGADVIVCPACALPAFTHGASELLLTAGAYATLYNVLGWPAGVVPFTRVRAGEEVGRAPSRDVVQRVARRVEEGSAGLPVGVQVVARPWREHEALATMLVLERHARELGELAPMPGTN